MSAHHNFWAMLTLHDPAGSDSLQLMASSLPPLPSLTYSSSSPSSRSGSGSSSSPAGTALLLHHSDASIVPSSGYKGTAATARTMDPALPAGVSREEYEKTRANLLNMFSGSKDKHDDGATAMGIDSPGDGQAPGIASTASSAPSSTKRGSGAASLNNSARKPGASLTSISTTSTQLSDSSAPSASTLRTSASSSAAFTDPDNQRQESPPTSEEGDTIGKNTSTGSREGDNSFNAASAAAAALGMLAASPIKHDPRFANRQPRGDFTNHRHVVPASSPPMRSNSYLSSSAGGTEHGFLRTSPGSRSPEPGSGSGRGKSTTPVRTRLEDIALKSSAQIRRQRERLGLGEQDEMMDLDTDARHLSHISHHLMQGSLSDNDSDAGNDGPDSSFEDAQYDPALNHVHAHAVSLRASPLGAGLAPAFSLSPGRAGTSSTPARSAHPPNGSAHRKTPSYGVSASRNQGMLDRFMEISSSPKAAAAGAAARRSPEQAARYAGYPPEDQQDEADNEDRTHANYRALDYEPPHKAGASTPKTSVDRRAALLRSAGNDLPSPLLAQIRMLSDADYDSPGRSQHHDYRSHMLESPRHAGYRGAPGSLGLPASSSDAHLGIPPGTGSARKRKASYELMSPRGRVMNLERSSSSPPPQPSFGGPEKYAASSPRWLRTSSTHPGPSREEDSLFGGPSSDFTSARSRHAYKSSRDYEGLQLQQQYDETVHYAAGPDDPTPASASKPSKRKAKEGGSAKKPSKERLGSVTSSTAPSSANASGTSTPTPANFTPATVRIGQYDSNTKPPFSYAALIGQAIFSTPNRRMSLADIYTYIMTLYPFYKKQDAGWQNSIRHNLSLNECFVKTQRAPDEPGKGCLWSVLPGTEEQFTGGNFYKKGKIPKNAGGGAGGGGSERSSTSKSKKGKKAGSVASNVETMSAVSNDDSFDGAASVASSSFSGSMMMAVPPPGVDREQRALTRGASGLRQQAKMPSYADDEDPEDDFEDDREQEDSFDMDSHAPLPPEDVPPPPVTRSRDVGSSRQRQQQIMDRAMQRDVRFKAEPEPEAVQPRPKIILRHQRMASGNSSALRHAIERETTPEQEEPFYHAAPAQNDVPYDEGRLVPKSEEMRYSLSERSISAEPPLPEQQPEYAIPAAPHYPSAEDLGSPVRRTRTITAGRRPHLTSPPIMSSPPTNVFARVSQPYQPLRDAFSLPGQTTSSHAAALLSSPPPAGITGDVRMRRLPPPTPRSSGLRGEDLHASSAIFLPAPNIKPGRSSEFGSSRGSRMDDDGDEFEKPTLPPIHMLSPASTMPVVTQSPVSSVRASAAGKRSSSPSPKSSSQASSSAGGSGGHTRSPTFSRSGGRFGQTSSNGDVFKTPDRFGVSGNTPRLAGSPAKFAHLTNSNASRALQSMQHSTPKLAGAPGGRMAAGGLVTPGGYYDPYEYSAVVDEELERMLAKNRDAEAAYRQPGDARRPLPFPSPLDRTPKWQPWSPW